jgi:protein required for attachment to host cells
VVADRGEARFYDTEHPNSKLELAGRMTDPDAHLRDRDFKSDRPGRVFDHAPDSGRRGAVAHHGTGGERSPSRHEAELFARRIVDELHDELRRDRFDSLVLMAAPEFLGDLRHVMPKSLREVTAIEIDKDLVHQEEADIRKHLPTDVFDWRV